MKNQKLIIMDDEDAFKQRSFNLRESEHTALRKIAGRLGCKFAGEISTGRMLRQIANGKLKVTR